MSVTILRANALALPLADASVDLVVTSPPYWSLRAYQDNGETYEGQIGAEPTPGEFVDNLIECTREWMRVLKPSGSIWVNLGDKMSSGVQSGVPGKSLIGIPWRYAIRCIDELGLILRAEVIWSKPNGLPESVTDRVRRSHEQWFHFTKEPRYFSAVDEIREPHKSEPGREGKGALGGQKSLRPVGPNSGSYNTLGALPGSVWTVPTEPLQVPDHLGIDHFAAFPTEFPRRIIQGWSPRGVCVECGFLLVRDTLSCPNCGCSSFRPAVIADTFGGTGTTALVADVLGRHGITVDLSQDYCRLAEWRTTDPKQRAKAARVEAAEPVPDDQLSLFEEPA